MKKYCKHLYERLLAGVHFLRRIIFFEEIWIIPILSAVLLFMCVLGDDSPARGVVIQFGDALDVFAFRNWIVMMTLPILWNVGWLSKCGVLCDIIILRYKSHKCFCSFLFAGSIIHSAFYATTLLIISTINHAESEAVQLWLLLFTNQSFWAVFITSLFINIRSPVGVVLYPVGAMCGAFFVSEKFPRLCHLSPASWGMIVRSSVYSNNGPHPSIYILYNVVGVCVILAAERFLRGKPYENYCS